MRSIGRDSDAGNPSGALPDAWQKSDSLRASGLVTHPHHDFDILRLGNIYFDYNKATIRPESRDSLSKIAGVLEEYPNVRVRVEGHTDSIASERYNQQLSDARAAYKALNQ